MTPDTKIMISWHPVPGDIPPEGCEYAFADSKRKHWTRWPSGEWPSGDRVMPVEIGHLKQTPHWGAFVFQIPLPPQYAVTITDDTTLREAQAILDGLFAKVALNTVDTAYADYVANCIGDYEDRHHAI